jgi:hypothetical protein
MPVPASALTRRQARRSRLWTPSARELWCYAIILAASRDRKSSPGNDSVLGTSAAPPPNDAVKPVSCFDQNTITAVRHSDWCRPITMQISRTEFGRCPGTNSLFAADCGVLLDDCHGEARVSPIDGISNLLARLEPNYAGVRNRRLEKVPGTSDRRRRPRRPPPFPVCGRASSTPSTQNGDRSRR